MKDKIVEILKGCIDYAEDADGLGRLFGLKEAANSIDTLYKAEVQERYDKAIDSYRKTFEMDPTTKTEQRSAFIAKYSSHWVVDEFTLDLDTLIAEYVRAANQKYYDRMWEALNNLFIELTQKRCYPRVL